MPQNESQQKSKQFITKISDEAERKHGEKMLDEAIENTFPASDPVSAEQPVHAHLSFSKIPTGLDSLRKAESRPNGRCNSIGSG